MVVQNKNSTWHHIIDFSKNNFKYIIMWRRSGVTRGYTSDLPRNIGSRKNVYSWSEAKSHASRLGDFENSYSAKNSSQLMPLNTNVLASVHQNWQNTQWYSIMRNLTDIIFYKILSVQLKLINQSFFNSNFFFITHIYIYALNSFKINFIVGICMDKQ